MHFCAAHEMRLLVLVFLMGTAVYACGSPTTDTHANIDEAKSEALQQGSIVRGALERSYLIYVPSGALAAGRPLPLVMVFHGAFGTAEAIAAQSRFHCIAKRDGFLVV